MSEAEQVLVQVTVTSIQITQSQSHRLDSYSIIESVYTDCCSSVLYCQFLIVFIDQPFLEESNMTSDILVSTLNLELERTNAAFTRWTENKLSYIQASDANYKRQEEECLFTIRSLKENESQLHELNKTNENIKLQQKLEIDRYINQIDKLQSQVIVLQNQLEKFSEEEKSERQKMENLKIEYKSMKEKSDKSQNDFTRGVQLYSHLGLEFQKAPNDCMKFIFTKIDQENPEKQFSFLIFVDQEDKYQFVESNPTLDSAVTSSLIRRLNQNSDISYFVVQMRRYFCKSLTN